MIAKFPNAYSGLWPNYRFKITVQAERVILACLMLAMFMKVHRTNESNFARCVVYERKRAGTTSTPRRKHFLGHMRLGYLT